MHVVTTINTVIKISCIFFSSQLQWRNENCVLSKLNRSLSNSKIAWKSAHNFHVQNDCESENIEKSNIHNAINLALNYF